MQWRDEPWRAWTLKKKSKARNEIKREIRQSTRSQYLTLIHDSDLVGSQHIIRGIALAGPVMFLLTTGALQFPAIRVGEAVLAANGHIDQRDRAELASVASFDPSTLQGALVAV
jgi:hypothetical protein